MDRATYDQICAIADTKMKAKKGHQFQMMLKTRCIHCGRSPLQAQRGRCGGWFMTYLDILYYELESYMQKEQALKATRQSAYNTLEENRKIAAQERLDRSTEYNLLTPVESEHGEETSNGEHSSPSGGAAADEEGLTRTSEGVRSDVPAGDGSDSPP